MFTVAVLFIMFFICGVLLHRLICFTLSVYHVTMSPPLSLSGLRKPSE